MLADLTQSTGMPSMLDQPQTEERTALDEEIFVTLRTTLPTGALVEIYTIFLADTRKRLAGLRESSAPSAVAQVVHAIRGSAGMIGAIGIAALSERLGYDPNAPTMLLAACEQLQEKLRDEGLPL